MITVSCVCANHLGLVDAVERVIGCKLPIVNCSKCFSWWSCLAYCIITTHNIIPSFAISFLASISALWFDVFLGVCDNLYYYAYERVYKYEESVAVTDGEDSKEHHEGVTERKDEMPEMWWVENE